jgi:metal-responsive CopG/Arc/MetJ family transcriptional regulator
MPQISASLTNKTIDEINKLAEKERRSFSEMVKILLESAVHKSKPAHSNNQKIKIKS